MAETRDRPRVMEEYRPRGCRFDRMMGMIEKGATFKEMEACFDGMEISAYLVLKAIDNGTISTGLDRPTIMTDPGKLITNALLRKERDEQIFRMLDEGAKIREVQERFGIGRGAAEHAKGRWAIARGLAAKRRGGA